MSQKEFLNKIAQKNKSWGRIMLAAPWWQLAWCAVVDDWFLLARIQYLTLLGIIISSNKTLMFIPFLWWRHHSSQESDLSIFQDTGFGFRDSILFISQRQVPLHAPASLDWFQLSVQLEEEALRQRSLIAPFLSPFSRIAFRSCLTTFFLVKDSENKDMCFSPVCAPPSHVTYHRVILFHRSWKMFSNHSSSVYIAAGLMILAFVLYTFKLRKQLNIEDSATWERNCYNKYL